MRTERSLQGVGTSFQLEEFYKVLGHPFDWRFSDNIMKLLRPKVHENNMTIDHNWVYWYAFKE